MSVPALLAGFLGLFNITTTFRVDSTTFNNIQRYTQFAGAAYAEYCPTIPYNATVLQRWNQTDSDIAAVLFHDSTANEVILSFRGSAFPRNLDTDLLFSLVDVNLPGVSCPGCQVHTGFQSAYQPIQASVLSAVQSAVKLGFFTKLIVTGHSLGGGLASLASASLAGSGLTPYVYTFGEPRNGNAAFTTYINQKIGTNYLRVTHYNDGVPQIPPQNLGYEHHGIEIWESLSSNNTAASTLACPGIESPVCNSAQDFGVTAINGAHIVYTNQLIASVLYNPACGYTFPS